MSPKKSSRRDGDGAVVAPLVGIADLIGDALKFQQRLFFRRGAHPGEPFDLALHGRLDVFGHGESARFRFRSECFVDEHVAQASPSVWSTSCSQRFQRGCMAGHAAQVIVEEIEVGLRRMADERKRAFEWIKCQRR